MRLKIAVSVVRLRPWAPLDQWVRLFSFRCRSPKVCSGLWADSTEDATLSRQVRPAPQQREPVLEQLGHQVPPNAGAMPASGIARRTRIPPISAPLPCTLGVIVTPAGAFVWLISIRTVDWPLSLPCGAVCAGANRPGTLGSATDRCSRCVLASSADVNRLSLVPASIPPGSDVQVPRRARPIPPRTAGSFDCKSSTRLRPVLRL